MIRSAPLATQIFNHLFPYPQKGVDPMTWREHVEKHLVPEIQLEVYTFYGEESRTLEGRYPGMDYSSSYHRMRLRRYTHHRRLFRAMDAMSLTAWEIYKLCDWEGTLLVKGRYEHQQGFTFQDTTGDEVAVASDLIPCAPLASLEDTTLADGGDVDPSKDDDVHEEIDDEEDLLLSAEEDEEDEEEEEVEEEEHDDDGTRAESSGRMFLSQHIGRSRAVHNMSVSMLHQARLAMMTASRGSTPPAARAAA